MSLLIADIGASSSRWALLNAAGAVVLSNTDGVQLPGFNAASGEPAAMVAALRAWMGSAPELAAAERLQVYGAGCGAPDRALRMKNALEDLWPGATVQVDSDLLGAARAACGRESGLVLILGTGMNAGHYDGHQLTTTIPSLGYIIGDEGSGADIGKQLFRDLFQGRMPEDVQEQLFGHAVPALHDVVAAVYRGEAPARYLAAPVVALLPLLEHPYVHGLITTRFRKLSALLTGWFTEDQRAGVAAVGSVANGLHDLLGPCLAEQGMVLTTVTADPMPGLQRYHAGLRP